MRTLCELRFFGMVEPASSRKDRQSQHVPIKGTCPITIDNMDVKMSWVIFLARGPSRVFLGPRARIHRLAYTPSSSVGLSFPDCTC
jgi:hypothetical protein